MAERFSNEPQRKMASEENNVAAETKEVQESTPETKTETKEKETTPAPEPQPPKSVVRKINFEKDTVYLYQISRTPVVPSFSPYCLQVETWLRLAGIKYENVIRKMKYRSKNGHLPIVELNGEKIAGVEIIQELAQQFNKELDITLDNEQKKVSHKMVSMIENSLYPAVVYWRMEQADNMIKGYKANLKDVVDTWIPSGIIKFFFGFRYWRMRLIQAHGLTAYKPETILEYGLQDLEALSDLLADKPFFFGDEPKMLDVVAFANLAQIYFVDKEVSFPLRDFMQESYANLVGLVNRMKDTCFQDWDDICTTLDLNTHLQV